jgi:hypothetical protein
MNDQNRNDEILLIGFLLGRCDRDAAEDVQDRLSRDKPFRRLHDDISSTFAAMQLLPEPQSEGDLVEKTLSRIQAVRQTEALIAREELTRPAVGPTFSFRELGVAAAAVLIMGILFIPSIRQLRRVARRNECYSQVGQIGTALLNYAITNDGYLPGVDGESRRWLPATGQPAVSNSAALFKLVNPHRYVQSPVLFQCPAIGGSSFEVKASMTDFPAGKYIAYSYQHAVGSRRVRTNDPVLGAVQECMAILSDSTPVFSGGKFHANRVRARTSDNHGGTGQNVLYLDMHVEWTSDSASGVDGDNIFLVKGIYEYRGDEAPSEPTDTFLLPSFTVGDKVSRP